MIQGPLSDSNPSSNTCWMDGVLEFLRTTRVGCIRADRVPPEEEGGEDGEGEEGRPGPP